MKIAVFIDGGHLHKLAKTYDSEVDFAVLRDHHAQEGIIATPHYFIIAPVYESGISPIFKLTDWLDYNGYRMHAIEVDCASGESASTIATKRTEIVVSLAVSMIEAARTGIDAAIIYSGDGALVPAVEAMQRQGVMVSVAFDKAGCADELRRAADKFIDADRIRSAGILKPAKQRVA